MMDTLFSYLFLVKGGQVAIYSNIGGHYVCIPHNGNKYLSFDRNFWTIWSEIFSFDPDCGNVDFAFITTDPNLTDFYLPENFRMIAHSEWTLSKIKNFMQDILPVRPYNLWEGDIPILTAPDKIAENYYATRFNVEKREKKEEKSSSIYEAMLNDPLPTELRNELKKKL